MRNFVWEKISIPESFIYKLSLKFRTFKFLKYSAVDSNFTDSELKLHLDNFKFYKFCNFELFFTKIYTPVSIISGLLDKLIS